MKTSELRNIMNSDRIIDTTRLDEELTRIPILHGKYYEFLMIESNVFKKLDLEYKKLKKNRIEYYLGRAEDDVYLEKPLNLKLTRQDLEVYLDADPEIQEMEIRIHNQKSKVDLLQQFITYVINTRGFIIRDLIALERFKNGLN